VANKLGHMLTQAKGIIQRIKAHIIASAWTGSDETGTHVGGKKFWQWVWQSPLASYYVVDKRRGYEAVKEHFTQTYQGVLIHDCWSAQNNTPAGAHQLCHAHLVRNLQYAIDKERSVFAYRVQRLLLKSERARDAIWQEGVTAQRRQAVIKSYQDELTTLLQMAVTKPEERRLQKRLSKHQNWIFTFMSYPDVPPDNNSSERAGPGSKTQGQSLWRVSFRTRSIPLRSTAFSHPDSAQTASSHPCLLEGGLSWARSSSFLSLWMSHRPTTRDSRDLTRLTALPGGPFCSFLPPS